MIKAKDIMSRDLITVKPEMEIVAAAKILLDKGINGAPVVDDAGRVLGLLCQSDLVAQQKNFPLPTLFSFLDGFFPLTSLKKIEHEVKKMAAITVEQAMTAEPVTVSPETPIEEVAALMVDKYFHTIPVVENDKLVGVIGKADILRTIMDGASTSE